jgi:capsular polysaccharide biosynthesis protein
MELKEYFQIIKKNLKLFVLTIIIILLSTFLFFYFTPISYTTSLELNISRKGVQNTPDYRYDNFYRLQADEKFAETIVEWLKSPWMEENIYREAGIDTSDFSLKRLSKSIVAEKMSSQIVVVGFSAPNQKIAQNIAAAISKNISQSTDNLNKDQNDITWFEIIAENPVIKINEVSPLIMLAIFFGTVFVAFWVVMVKHYLE